MIEWNEMHLQIRDMMRRFVEQEVKPNLEALEHGDLPPYEILRKMIKSFGIADMAKARFARDKDRAPRSDDGDMYPGGVCIAPGCLSPLRNSHSRTGWASRCACSSLSAT